MSAQASQIQWYLARDGQQYGPLTELELATFIELGHLQPTDLLWREGFPDWRPAMVVFPQAKPAPRTHQPAARPASAAASAEATADVRPHAQQRAAAGPAARTGPAHAARAYGEPEEEEPARGRGLRRALLLVTVLALVGGAGWYGYERRASIVEFAASLQPSAATTAPVSGADRKSLSTSPLAGFTGSVQEIDANLQATPLWRVIKREFPDWYAERLKEIAALVSQNKDEAAVGQRVARALVALRRENAKNALSADFRHLKVVATTFFENLVQLRKQSTQACFEFISQGEASPTIVALLQGSPHTAHLQAQLTAVFEAVADGRRAARVYPQPRKADYDVLQADLAKLGWTQADMQLFSDEKALARASHEKVCQLVHDWFAAQLAIKDADTQLRLLVDSLKPVVAG